MGVYRKIQILSLLFSISILSARGEQILVINEQTASAKEINLEPYLYLDKAPLKKCIQDLHVNQAYTFNFQIKNNTNDTLDRIISFGQRYIVAYKIILQFSDKKEKIVIAGPSNNISFNLGPGEDVKVFFQLPELDRINPEKISVRLFEPGTLQNKVQKMYIAQSFFLGLLSFLCIFNLIIFFVTGWKLYLKYVLYIFTALLYFLYYYGFLQSWIASVQYISVNLIYTWYSIIFISYFIFLNHFGNYKTYVPKAYFLLNVGIVFKSIETVINTFLHFLNLDFIYSTIYINIILGFEIILMSFILFYIVKNKSIQGRLIIIASIFLIGGGILEQTKVIQDIEPTLFIQLGITFELLTFSVGLGYLTKQYYEEKRKNQQLYIEQLKENEQIQKRLNNELEEKVKTRTLELEKEKQLVEKKSKENELMMMEIHHRVKNNLQMIVSLLNMQERTIENEEAKKALLSGKERIKAIEMIHKMLYTGNKWQQVDINGYISTLVQYFTKCYGYGKDNIETIINIPIHTISNPMAIPLGLILNELITNSFKHAHPDPQKLKLTITLAEEGNNLLLFYRDNGEGKSFQLEKSKSLGFRIIMILVKQLNADIEIKDQSGLEYRILIKNYKTIEPL